eukprot:5364457-Alexandrium_andersonii.AAC.2
MPCVRAAIPALIRPICSSGAVPPKPSRPGSTLSALARPLLGIRRSSSSIDPGPRRPPCGTACSPYHAL